MSILYKEQPTTQVIIDEKDNIIKLTFKSDCGKFGADEILDYYKLTPERLLEILQSYTEYEDHEI